jgi:hypothetical protein
MAHPDLNSLFDAVLSFAKLMLNEHGEFYPFGATMSPSGEITNVGAKVKGDHHPRSQTLIDLLTEAFQQKAASGQIRAAAICYDARTIPPGETNKTDAICCGLEHRSGESVDVFIPYKKTSDNDFQYGEIFATKRTAIFFAARLFR